MNKDIMVKLYELRQLADKNSEDIAYNYTLYKNIEKYIDNLKQALIDIRNKINSINLCEKDYWLDSEECDDILQIIDKVLGDGK